MSQIKEILSLTREGRSGRWIAKMLGTSRNTVAKILNAEREHPISEAMLKMKPEGELHALLFPEEASGGRIKEPDYDRIYQELKRPGVTLKLLWEEYTKDCSREDLQAYQYSRFCDLYSQHAKNKGLTMVLHHKPGDEVMVDWAGTMMEITDLEQEVTRQVPIFVGVLPFSMYIFAMGCQSMAEEEWIHAHVMMYEFFGGVPRLLICDNTKTAVLHNRKYEEVILNRTYTELAQHYRANVVPARVYRPRDKAAVEGSVKVVTQQIIAPLRDMVFHDIDALNAAIREQLDNVNQAPFQKREGSRVSVFQQEEAKALQPLPATPFETPVWRTATVQKNYHVCFERENYSVPCSYVGRKVDIRATRSTVTIFYEGTEIASHERSSKRYQTDIDHMPAGHRRKQEWHASRFLDWAQQKGDSVREVVRRILISYPVEEQAYKSLFALLNLPKRFPKAHLETACAQILAAGGYISLKRVTALMQKMHEEAVKNNAAPPYAKVRGNEYYAANSPEVTN